MVLQVLNGVVGSKKRSMRGMRGMLDRGYDSWVVVKVGTKGAVGMKQQVG